MKYLTQFWPFPLVRNYRSSSDLTRLFLAFSRSNNFLLRGKEYGVTTVSCEHGDLRFWSENKYYAFASRGSFHPVDDSEIKWSHEMPSRYAVREMAKRIGSADSKFHLHPGSV